LKYAPEHLSIGDLGGKRMASRTVSLVWTVQGGMLIGIMIGVIIFLGWFYRTTLEDTPSEFLPGRVALFVFVLVATLVISYLYVKFVLVKDRQESQKSRE
jgi:hypothetical protein